jgi:hypothetical protein
LKQAYDYWQNQPDLNCEIDNRKVFGLVFSARKISREKENPARKSFVFFHFANSGTFARRRKRCGSLRSLTSILDAHSVNGMARKGNPRIASVSGSKSLLDQKSSEKALRQGFYATSQTGCDATNFSKLKKPQTGQQHV